MKSYKDVFTSDVVLNDTFSFKLDYSGSIIKVNSEYVPVSEADEDADVRLLNLQHNFDLVAVALDINDFTIYIKDYSSRLRDHLQKNKPERVTPFLRGGQAFWKWATLNFNELELYTGRSEDLKGGLIYSYWENDNDPGPVFYYFADGLV